MNYRFFFAFLLFHTTLFAENDSVDKLIDNTLKNHPSIQMSRQTLKGSQAQVNSAKWGYFPTPSVDVSQGAQGRRGVTLRLDQPLWTGGKLDAAVDIAKSQETESLYSLDEAGYTLVDTMLQTIQTYLTAQGEIIAIKEGKKQLEDLDMMLNRRIKAGVSAISDQELLKSRLTQTNADLSTAINMQEMAHAQLEVIVGEKISDNILFNQNIYLNQDGDLRQFIDEMVKTNPTLKRLSAQIVRVQAEKEKTKAAIWPNFSVRAEHQDGSVYANQAVTSNLIYFSLQASTGAGLSAYSNIQSAEANVLKAKFQKMTQQKDLINSFLHLYSEWHSTKDKINDITRTIEASQNVFESYSRLFITGKRQWLDLVNASRELTQEKISLADMHATLLTSGYRVALQRGKLNLTLGTNQ